MKSHISGSLGFGQRGVGAGIGPVFTVLNVFQMLLKMVHDPVFGLAYILGLTCYTSDKTDQIVESACEPLWYNVGFLG